MQTLVLQTFDDTNMPFSKILSGRFYSQSNMWWQQCSHHNDKVDIVRVVQGEKNGEHRLFIHESFQH